MTGSSVSSNPQPLVDLSRLAAGVLWRRRIWGSLAMLGVVAGLVATLVLSFGATAVTKVVIARVDDTATSQETLMDTDVALFNTTATAADAARRLNTNVAPVEFAKTFQGEALTANVLVITAEAPSDSEAVRRADALARTFIDEHVDRARSEAEAQSQALLDRRKELQQDLSAATDTTGGQDAQRRADITAQLTTLGEEAQQAIAGVPRVEAGTRIVDPPRALDPSFLFTAATNVAVGLVLGLTGGVALAAVLCVTRDRPVLRRDIAEELNVSIVAALPALTRARLRTRGRGARVDQRAADTLVRLVGADTGRVSLLELGCPRTAGALRDAINEQLDDGAVELGSVSPGTSWIELDELGSHTLLIIRAGHASTLWLHTVARRLDEAGIIPIGAVLVAPYPWDNTDGALWHWPHPAPRPRTAAASRPANKKSEVKVP